MSNMLLVKMQVNIVISTIRAKFMKWYIKNFYLNTPIKRYKYVRLQLEDSRKEIVTEKSYNKNLSQTVTLILR